ncbi:MAG: hypothetical protein ACE5F8_03100 [Woeseiaceae bacterium]
MHQLLQRVTGSLSARLLGVFLITAIVYGATARLAVVLVATTCAR